MKERLKQRRKELRLSLQNVATLAGSGKSYIWELENNSDLKPSAEKLQNIASALQTTVNYLMTGNTTELISTQMLNTYHKLSTLNKATLFEFATILLRNQETITTKEN